MSFSTDLGGICLGRGDTITCFREGGTTPSRKEVLYISAISGASSKANSLSTILSIPSGPGAYSTHNTEQQVYMATNVETL